MKKVDEFRRRASHCRELAQSGTSADIRRHYQQLAEMWDRLAEERLTFFVTTEAEEVG
jgi:hypothetical protein